MTNGNKKLSHVTALILDYGGTIDSNGRHWAEVIWDGYCNSGAPVSKVDYRQAYVYAERYLATHRVIESGDNFLKTLQKKINIQLEYLVSNDCLKKTEKTAHFCAAISEYCYNFALEKVETAKITLDGLQKKFQLALTSNFYGNIEAVLADFGLRDYFEHIIESAVVGVRKPDPQIFQLALDAIGSQPDSVAVVGDSYSKDIVPARTVGCTTIWLQGEGWEDVADSSAADYTVTDFADIRKILM
jgi:putative hydrolase of the HAD superfamily